MTFEQGDHYQSVAKAFSYKATIYDGFGEDHPNLLRMRHEVYRQVLRYAKPGSHILEINAGTGGDAVFLANQGFNVHATDIAPGMVAAIQEKIQRYGLRDRLTAEICSFLDLPEVQDKPYDYIFSNFGGLNCIEDLSLVTWQLPGLLAPGGRLTWVIMPPVCLWDLALTLKGDFRQAFRRLHRHGTLANVEGVHFQVRYYTPNDVLQALGNDFKLLDLKGLSIFAPPADRKFFARRFPGIYRLLVGIDERLSSWPPFNGWGDFFILSAEYRP